MTCLLSTNCFPSQYPQGRSKPVPPPRSHSLETSSLVAGNRQLELVGGGNHGQQEAHQLAEGSSKRSPSVPSGGLGSGVIQHPKTAPPPPPPPPPPPSQTLYAVPGKTYQKYKKILSQRLQFCNQFQLHCKVTKRNKRHLF